MADRTLAHVTLTTGDVRASPRSEVSHEIVVLLAPLLARALAGREVFVPGQACTMTGARGGDCAVVTVWAADGAPLATIGLARGEDEAPLLWRMLHETEIGAPSVTHAEHPPDAPWCGARLELGLALHPEEAHWLGDLERCLAWTWIESGGHLAQALTRPPPTRRAGRAKDHTAAQEAKLKKRKDPAAVALGRKRSPAKAAAVRANGMLGGRPRESLPCRLCGTKTTDRDASRRPWCGCAR